jgi:hypothetical protein
MAAERAVATLRARRNERVVLAARGCASANIERAECECLNTRVAAPAALAAWMYAEVARLELGHSRRKAQTPRRQLSPKSRAASSGTKSVLRAASSLLCTRYTACLPPASFALLQNMNSFSPDFYCSLTDVTGKFGFLATKLANIKKTCPQKVVKGPGL